MNTAAAQSRGELKTKILQFVVARFVNLKQESTPRRELIVRFEAHPEAADVIAGLLNGNILRRKDASRDVEYLPTVGAFELCGEVLFRSTAKLGVTVVLHTLRKMYLVESDRSFSFVDLKERIYQLNPDRIIDEETIKLGLYLVQDFYVLTSHNLNSAPSTADVRFMVGEGIITQGDPEKAWDKVASNYRPQPEQLPTSVPNPLPIDLDLGQLTALSPGCSPQESLLGSQALDPVITATVRPLFLNGDYDTAVFRAFREVEERVRAAGKFAASAVGVSLMRDAFKPQTGPLADKSIPLGEQEMMQHLFAGAIGTFKNPSSHRAVKFTSNEAATLILFANYLISVILRLSAP